ncbi:putative lectin family integral membrane protein [Peziza echinospora]|nr:putative lectin family integral membrane protein [Peziza echinospora]
MRLLSGLFVATVLALQSALCVSAAEDPPKQRSKDDPDVRTVPLRTHSLYQPYLDSDLNSRWFDWGGDAVIRADQYIRLTGDRPDQAGWIFSRLPLTATNWEIEFEFKIHGKGNLYGDGMALWITKQRGTTGPVFGSTDNFDGLAIFFDTYKNNRPGVIFPYVMAMMGDGQTSYNHANDGKMQELAGCSARGIRGATIPTKGRLTYFQEHYLQLELQYKEEGVWTTCFNTPNVTIPSVAYLGFSAHCGELSDNHDIVSIATKNLYSAKYGKDKDKQKPVGPNTTKQKKGKKNKQKNANNGGGGWTWFLFKGVLVLGVAVGAYFGWVAYRTQNRRNSRF